MIVNLEEFDKKLAQVAQASYDEVKTTTPDGLAMQTERINAIANLARNCASVAASIENMTKFSGVLLDSDVATLAAIATQASAVCSRVHAVAFTQAFSGSAPGKIVAGDPPPSGKSLERRIELEIDSIMSAVVDASEKTT